MFKQNKKQVFSFRKYKGYGLASAVIAAFFLSQTVSADVVNNGDGTTTLSNDKASVVVETSKFKDDNEKTATELFNEGSYEAETVTTGKESVAVESKTTVKYQTEDGEQIDEDVVKTTSETKELDYKVTGKSGKEYTGDDSATTTVNADLEKKDIIENDGKKYEYVRTETSAGEESALTDTAFNDVNVKASVQGMHNSDGSVKYDKIENGTRVWVLEELEDGSYGKYALIENAQNLNDDQIREAAKTATSKFSKAEVDAKGGFQPTDSVVVYETNTYAARKQTSEKFGKDFYYNMTVDNSKFYKSYIDDIYKVGLEGLEKQGDKYYYKGKEVPTIEDFKTIYEASEDPETLGIYGLDESNKYYISSYGYYVVPTTYYDVLSDFLIAHPDSSIFAGKANEVFWGNGNEIAYFQTAFAARLMNEALKSKYNLNIDTPNFSNKLLDSKTEEARPTEKKMYSFDRTDLNGDAESYPDSVNSSQDDLWKHEIGLSYSSENVERVRRFVKGLESLNGDAIADPFNDKPASEITKQEYTDVVFNRVSGLYFSTYKGQFTSEQIQELRAKFGDSVFDIVGNVVQPDLDSGNSSNYVFYGTGSNVFRNSLGVVTENTESFTYHDEITPLRAYRLNADENVVRHIYAEVKKGSVVATYSDEDGNKLADDVNVKTDEYAGENYTTEAKQIRPIYDVETVNGLTKTTITRYELIKTPDNANGKVVAETTILVPYVYRKVVTVDIKGSVIATYKDEEGNILASEEKVITNQNAGTYYAAAAKDIQASATSKITENGREVTLITYELIKTPDNETGEVVGGETLVVPYVYRKVVTNKLVPNNPPVVEEETLKVTRFHSDTGEELQSDVAGFEDAPKIIGDYQFTGTTETNEAGDVQTHIYTKIQTEVPGDAPQVDVLELKVTRYQTEDGTEIKDSEEGFVDAPNTIGDYQFTGVTNMNEGNDVQTHIYSKIVTEVPGDAPSVDVPALKVTRYQTEDGIDIKDSEEGFVDAPNTIGDYQFTGVTNMNEGDDVQTHIYSKIVTEIPRESLVLDKIEYKMTRYVDEQGQELTLFDFGLRGPKAIEDYVFTGRTDSNKAGDVLTHVYRKVVVESKVPGDAPQYDIPELKVTRHVDEKGKELIETEKGTQPPRKTIRENEYTGRTTEKDGITTHVYAPIKHEVPGDAPIVDVPELKVTRYVNEKGEEIKESEAGFIDAPKTIGEYEFTGKTEFNDGKDVQTHIYKLVEKPVTPTPDPKKPEAPSPRTPEPKKPETPQPEAPKPIETFKSNDSVVESVDQPQFVKNELPKTGDTNSNLALVGVSLLTALGLIGFAKRKRED